VNRMCLAANVPMVESGSGGYLGQCTVIIKGETECFECQPQPAARQFPVCTIRNTPSQVRACVHACTVRLEHSFAAVFGAAQPVHCIVWAKFLFQQLFGSPDDDSDVSPNAADPRLALGTGDATAAPQKRLRVLAEDSNVSWPFIGNDVADNGVRSSMRQKRYSTVCFRKTCQRCCAWTDSGSRASGPSPSPSLPLCSQYTCSSRQC
jgi:hypothetical protein